MPTIHQVGHPTKLMQNNQTKGPKPKAVTKKSHKARRQSNSLQGMGVAPTRCNRMCLLPDDKSQSNNKCWYWCGHGNHAIRDTSDKILCHISCEIKYDKLLYQVPYEVKLLESTLTFMAPQQDYGMGNLDGVPWNKWGFGNYLISLVKNSNLAPKQNLAAWPKNLYHMLPPSLTTCRCKLAMGKKGEYPLSKHSRCTSTWNFKVLQLYWTTLSRVSIFQEHRKGIRGNTTRW
jgi:hypothetical protein